MRPLEKFTMGIGPLLVCGFGVPMTNSMIFPALSDLQDKYGFSDAGLGYIAASGFLASLIVQLTLAPLADRRNPKMLVLTGVVFAIAGSVLFAFGGSLPVFVIARAVAGSAFGMSGPAVRALAANIDRSRAAERMARLRGVEIAGFTGGPLIGALLIGPFGIRGAFLVFAGVGVLVFLAVLTRELPALPTTAESGRPSLELLRLRPVRAAVLASATLFLPVGIYDALWDRYITDRGGNNFQVGLTFLLFTVPFIVFGAKGGRLVDRRGPERMILVGIGLMVPLVLVYGLLPTAELLVAFAVVEGLISAISTPSAQSLMARVAPLGRASAAQGLQASGDLVGAILMSFAAPWMYGAHGPAFTFGVAAALMAVMGIVVAAMLRGGRVSSDAR
ncbi:MAG: MFS transporter [Acidimicrobiales bacterium]